MATPSLVLVRPAGKAWLRGDDPDKGLPYIDQYVKGKKQLIWMAESYDDEYPTSSLETVDGPKGVPSNGGGAKEKRTAKVRQGKTNCESRRDGAVASKEPSSRTPANGETTVAEQ